MMLIDLLAMMLFAIEGGRNAKSPALRIVFGLLECCGGGAILRDILILGRMPVILSSPMELYVYSYVALQSVNMIGMIWNLLLPLSDMIGIIAFIIGGSNHGFDPIHRILCGFVSGVGGGFQSCLYRGRIRTVWDIIIPARVLALVFAILNEFCGNFCLGRILLPIFYACLDPKFRKAVKKAWRIVVKKCTLPQMVKNRVILTAIDCNVWKPNRKAKLVLWAV